MELTIKKIIDIDKDAESYRKNMDELLLNKRSELEKLLEQMKIDNEESLNIAKKALIERKEEEARANAEVIKEKREEQLKELRQKYLSCKEELVDACFNEILNSYQEV